jgi:hypothetical protein
MRLWTLHPKYLDPRGLVALWREALLAQAVLAGKTRGYTHHPQLLRFHGSPMPMETIAFYLQVVHDEACRRDYHFDAKKIAVAGRGAFIETSEGQLEYEWEHLKAKLRLRSPLWLAGLENISHPEPHPLFHIVAGAVAEWEIAPRDKMPRHAQ